MLACGEATSAHALAPFSAHLKPHGGVDTAHLEDEEAD